MGVATSEASLKPSRLFWFIPSLADMFFIAVFVAAFAGYGSQLFSRDGDTGRHLRLGDLIMSTLSIPNVDLFSHTRLGEQFVPFEWLSEVIFAAMYRLLGLYGVAFTTSLVVALVHFILFRFMLRLGVNYIVAMLLTILAAGVSSVHWLARPHIFTLLFVLIAYVLLELYQREGNRSVLVLPAIIIVWANTHGGFLLAFILVGVYLVGNVLYAVLATERTFRHSSREKAKTLAFVGVSSVLASLVNPSGLSQLPHLLGYLRLSYLVDSTLEYQSPNFHIFRMQVFLVLILLVIATLALSQRRVSIIDLANLVILTYFSLYSVRNIPIFAIVVAPIIGVRITHLLNELSDSPALPASIRACISRAPKISSNLTRIENFSNKHLWPFVAVALIVGAGILIQNQGTARIMDFPPDRFPVSAAEFVKREGIQGNVFNELNWGGYLLYTLYPDHKVFIDGQTDFYGEALAREYATVANVMPGWDQVLDRYNVGWVLFPTQSPLSWTLAKHPSWRLVYSDQIASVFVRDEDTSAQMKALPGGNDSLR